MEPTVLSNCATLDPARLNGVTDLKLTNCSADCLGQLPPSLERLSLWWSAVPQPLRLDLPRLRRLSVNPSSTAKDVRVSIEALPAGLEELDLWSCVVDRLPDPMPPLRELTFDCCDLRALPWARLPASLVRLSAVRCELPEPLPLPELPALETASFYACNLKDARGLLQLPRLRLVHLGLSPLSPESEAALKASRKRGVDTMNARPADFELSRRLYEMGVNLSAEKSGKKILLHHPRAAVAEGFPREAVMALAEKVERGEARLSGKAFIEALRQQGYETRKAAKAAKQAEKARQAKP